MLFYLALDRRRRRRAAAARGRVHDRPGGRDAQPTTCGSSSVSTTRLVLWQMPFVAIAERGHVVARVGRHGPRSAGPFAVVVVDVRPDVSAAHPSGRAAGAAGPDLPRRGSQSDRVDRRHAAVTVALVAAGLRHPRARCRLGVHAGRSAQASRGGGCAADFRRSLPLATAAAVAGTPRAHSSAAASGSA